MEIVNEQRQKIHPHKFTLWVALGSIIMMFAGLTSAYVVKRELPGWSTYPIPRAFYYSTAVLLTSSLTIQMGIYPTTPQKGEAQGLITKRSGADGRGFGLGIGQAAVA